MVAGQNVIATHQRRFARNISYFEPWHYVPLLERKPGALRDGAPFVNWQLPASKAPEKIYRRMSGESGVKIRKSGRKVTLEFNSGLSESALRAALEQFLEDLTR